MDFKKLLDEGPLKRVDPRLATWVFDKLRRIPGMDRMVEDEFEPILDEIRSGLHPYAQEREPHRALPKDGLARESILGEMRDHASRERSRWEDGYVSGAVYHGAREHVDFLDEVYRLNSQTNPLHSDLWPRTIRYEAEVVSMCAHMLGASRSPDQIVGTLSSGGTESILLAMKSYRDRARDQRGIKDPEFVVPVSAHAAFDKAASYFGIKKVEIPVDGDFRADVGAAKAAISRNTIAMVGSAPSFPHGVVDPIPEMSELALGRGIGFHTDACLGGFVLPWAQELGYPVVDFDFRLPGVTSMSCDTHKYGYAAKGSSVVLYRGADLRRYQYFTTSDWPGGLYFSPSFAGSRPGALSASCWAAMVAMGEAGYRDAAQKILAAGARVRACIEEMPELEVLGDPLWVVAFRARDFDTYALMQAMAERGWNLNGLHRPACVHLCVTLRHTQEGVVERFAEDLKRCVDEVRDQPVPSEGMAPVYGLASSLPVRSLVRDLLARYIDLLYELPPSPEDGVSGTRD